MRTIAELVEQDLSNPKRCFFHGTTSLGGADACRPEMAPDGETIIMRSLNLSHVAYRVSYSEYRKLREHPKLKIGIWEFVDENDEDADRIASATRYPESAGRKIGYLERRVSALTEALKPFAEVANEYDEESDEQQVWPTFTIGDFRRAAREVAK